MGALAENMKAKVGETVRIYVGNGGVNFFRFPVHVIEIFDRVYREGDLSEHARRGVQTTLVPAGGAAAVGFKLKYPGNYYLVDHRALCVLIAGVGVLRTEGEADPNISFDGKYRNRPRALIQEHFFLINHRGLSLSKSGSQFEIGYPLGRVSLLQSQKVIE